MKTLRDTVIIIAALAFVFIWWKNRPNNTVIFEAVYDTIVIRDTIRYEKPVERISYIVRTDTILLYLPADTVQVMVEVPIEQKEYSTEDFRAVIEGFRPSLLSMEVYPKNQFITRTEIRTITKNPRWGIGIQAGYGFGEKMTPYIGIGVQYNLLTF